MCNTKILQSWAGNGNAVLRRRLVSPGLDLVDRMLGEVLRPHQALDDGILHFALGCHCEANADERFGFVVREAANLTRREACGLVDQFRSGPIPAGRLAMQHSVGWERRILSLGPHREGERKHQGSKARLQGGARLHK
jgi:hypothetical protein